MVKITNVVCYRTLITLHFFRLECCDAVIRTLLFPLSSNLKCKLIIGLVSNNCSASCLGLATEAWQNSVCLGNNLDFTLFVITIAITAATRYNNFTVLFKFFEF